MKHTYPFQKYKELLTINHELDGLSFSKDDSREYILSKLEERSNKKREISNIANTIYPPLLNITDKASTLVDVYTPVAKVTSNPKNIHKNVCANVLLVPTIYASSSILSSFNIQKL